jgi:hypothetical protein
MSFLDNLGGLLKQFSGASPADVGAAAADHVDGMDPNALASHLTDSVQNLNGGQLSQLASSLLGALGNHGQDAGSVAAAGVPTDAATSGDSNAVADLIAHAQQNPAALKDAAMDFVKNNPDAVQQFTPDFLKGIVAKFTS